MKNFFHSIWINELEVEEVKRISNYIRQRFKNNRVDEKNDIISILMQDVPLLQFGIKNDNIIGVIISGHRDIGYNFVPDLSNEFLEIKEYVLGFKPDLTIDGLHTCKLNCNECCDTAPIERKVTRRYCEYYSELGGYCLAMFADEDERNEIRDEVCNRWWCHWLREPYSMDAYDGPFGLRPLIKEMKSYSENERKRFVRLIKLLSEGYKLKDVIDILPRTKEVRLYKNSLSEINKALENEGIETVIDIYSIDDIVQIEKKLKCTGSWKKVSKYIDNLYEWVDMVKKRKSLPYL